MNKLTISRGNSKLGRIPNISLTPGPCGSCAKDVPCSEGTCYAHKAYRQYPPTRKAWDGNLALYKEDPDGYWMQMEAFLYRTKKDRFRFHVAGDILDMAYLVMMEETVKHLHDIKFLCFTKRYDLLTEMGKIGPPSNLSLVVSRWPGWRTEQGIALGKHYPSAYMIPKGKRYLDVYPELNGEPVYRCPGDCTHCRQCWNLPHSKVKGVLFDEH